MLFWSILALLILWMAAIATIIATSDEKRWPDWLEFLAILPIVATGFLCFALYSAYLELYSVARKAFDHDHH